MEEDILDFRPAPEVLVLGHGCQTFHPPSRERKTDKTEGSWVDNEAAASLAIRPDRWWPW